MYVETLRLAVIAYEYILLFLIFFCCWYEHFV